MHPLSASPLDQLVDNWRLALQSIAPSREPISILYSGGLDSTLVALGLSTMGDVELVTVGTEGCGDLEAGEQGAKILRLPWRGRVVTPNDVQRILRTERVDLENASRVSLPVQVGIAFALDGASSLTVTCGQGADELFLGYAHFDGRSPGVTRQLRDQDLDRLMKDDWPLSLRLATRRGKRLVSPFLTPPFFGTALDLTVEQLRSGEGRKPLLRQLAVRLGVPIELAERRKRAFQYGSGIDRLLRSGSAYR